jgi:hypothetical protein
MTAFWHLQTAFPIAVFALVDRPFKDLKTYIRFPKVRKGLLPSPQRV